MMEWVAIIIRLNMKGKDKYYKFNKNAVMRKKGQSPSVYTHYKTSKSSEISKIR